MNKERIIKETIVFVKKRLLMEGTGHDWWHIERVIKNARVINKTEKADGFIVELAILLHDIGDYKVINKEEDDYTIAENFLRGNKLDSEIIDKIMFIIKNMSFSSSFLSTKNKVKSKEFYVAQDADRLDALGAIGIARLFAFGGSRNRSLYDPTMKIKRISSKIEYRKKVSSSFQHFYEKILLLKDLIHTKTAMRIAEKRHKYIENYMKEFLLEWKGKR